MRAAAEEELIVRLVFSSLPPRRRRNKLSSLDRYRCRLALGGGTVCEAEEGGGEKEKSLLGEEEESPGGQTDRRKNRTTSGKALLTVRKLEPSNRCFSFPYQWQMAPTYQTRALCPLVTDFLQAAVRGGNRPTLLLLSPSPSGSRKKKFLIAGCTQGRRRFKDIVFLFARIVTAWRATR